MPREPRSRRSRTVLRWSALGLGLLAAVSPVRAQPPAGEGGEPSQSRSPFFRRLRIVPSYTSAVDLNRSDFGWRQGLVIDGVFGSLRAHNDWALLIKENEASNNARTRNGTTTFRLANEAERFGGWSTGGQLAMRRNFNRTDFSRSVDNGSVGDFFVRTQILAAALARALGDPDSASAPRWTSSMSIGRTSGTNVRQQRSRATGFPLQRSDSTATDGTTRTVDTQLRIEALAGLSLDFSGSTTRTEEDSETTSIDRASSTADSFQITRTDNQSRGTSVSARAKYRPGARFETTVDARTSRNRSQFYSPLSRGQETRDGRDDLFDLALVAEPITGLLLNAHGKQKRTDIEAALDANDSRREESSADGKLSIEEFGPRFLLLRKISFDVEGSFSDIRFDRETLPDYDELSRRLKGGLKRPIGSRVAASISGEGQILRKVYDDGSQDFDELRFLVDSNLGYRPSRKADTRLTFQWSQRQTVYIPAELSSSNVTETTYRIESSVGYKLNPRVNLNQVYAIYAVASEFDFNTDNNNLARTSEVRSKVQTKITDRVALDLEHTYRFRDSGSYSRDARGVRRYGRAASELYQLLMVRPTYELTRWFRLQAVQRFETRSNKTLATGRVTNTERLDFTGGATIQHELSEGFKIDADLGWTETSAESPYWKVSFRMTRSY